MANNVPGDQGNLNASEGPSNNVNQDAVKRKMIQNQLIILIHAAKCQKRSDQGNNNNNELKNVSTRYCTLC